MDIQKNILGTLEQAPRQVAAMTQRAQALQADASFWKPGEEPNKFKCLPLWQAICIFKGMDPAHWALTSPAAAAGLERYTTGEVAARLKELVQLHTLALDGITMGRLKAPGNETKGFETDMVSLIEWAEKVGEGGTPETLANKPEIKHMPRQRAQEEMILKTLRDIGYEPLCLPKKPDGKDGVKAEVRKALRGNPLFAGTTVFDKAWLRLSNFDDIVIAKVSP